MAKLVPRRRRGKTVLFSRSVILWQKRRRKALKAEQKKAQAELPPEPVIKNIFE